MQAIAARLLKPKIDRSKRVISELMSKCKKPYLSWSGGKDSTIMLYLALQLNPQLDVIYFDANACLPDTEQYMERIKDEWAINTRVIKTMPIIDVLSKYGVNSSSVEYQTMKHTVYEPVKQLICEGYDGSLVGIRAEESNGRNMAAAKYGQIFKRKEYNTWQAWPMLWWKSTDIWLFIDSYNIPYSPDYDKTRFCSREEMRISYWAGETNRTYGRWVWLKYYYPELYNRLLERVPDASRYI